MMPFLISTLYTVFLGVLAQSLTVIEPNGESGRIAVHYLLRSSNLGRTLPLFVLFFIDWAVFMAVFPPSSTFSLRSADIVLLILYVPTLALLAASVVLSLGESLKFCGFLAGYHGLAMVAEVAWFVIRMSDLPTFNATGRSVALLFAFFAAYVAVRLGLVVWCAWIAAGRSTALQPQVLSFIALLVKPAFALVVASSPAIGLLQAPR